MPVTHDRRRDEELQNGARAVCQLLASPPSWRSGMQGFEAGMVEPPNFLWVESCIKWRSTSIV
jgi:hypothetical protein